MADEKVKIKSIIMDKAPAGSSITMGATLGYTPADYVPLVNELNTTLGTSIAVEDINSFNTVEEVYNYVVSQLP